MIIAQEKYEKIRPLIIWLGLTEMALISYWLLSANQPAQAYIYVVLFWITAMLIWLGIASVLGRRGSYLRGTRYFSNLIGFASVLAFTAATFTLLPSAWHGLVIAAKNTSDIQLVAIHILRILAIGTIIKYMHGEMPLYFLILGSLPDFIFAISAIGVTLLVASGQADQSFLLAWHMLGSLVFFGAGISMFFSVPSLIRITHNKPDTSIAFKYPMNLAPNYTVPLFVVAHAFALIKILAG